jgi:predicted ATPase
MLKSVEIKNFKNIRHQNIDLEPLTVFVGANGCGKTSVIQAIHYAVEAADPIPYRINKAKGRSFFEGERHCDWLYSRGGTGDLSIACTTSNGTFTVSASPPPDFPPNEIEHLGKGHWEITVDPSDPEMFKKAFAPARSTVFLHLDASELSKAKYSDRPLPRVESNGDGLAPYLAYMALNDPDGFERLVSEMRTLIPNLKRIRFTKKPVHKTETEIVRFGNDSVERRSRREYQGDAMIFDFCNANNLPAHAVSEGTMLLLGLLAVLLGPAKPDILLLDDIEHGLHPLLQKQLVAVIGKIMLQFPTLQILATAHSHYLLNYVAPEQVRIMANDGNGHALCGRLTEHPKFETWKDEMSSGEMWSLFGERWLADRKGTP